MRPRKWLHISGVSGPHALGVFNNTIDAKVRALSERYFLCKTEKGFEPALSVQTAAYVSDHSLQQFRARVVNELRGFPQVCYDDVVNCYSGRKRTLYEKAKDVVERNTITAAHARLSFFVKFEKQDLSKAPRVINPRSTAYNLELGTYLKFLEKPLYTAINKQFGARTSKTVIKGLNVYDTATVIRDKWQLFHHPVGIGLDASKFDMHVSVPALRYEHSFYKGVFSNRGNSSVVLNNLLEYQVHNRGVSFGPDGVVSYEMEGTRCSGDLNTSMGNCILMCALVYSYAKARGVDVELCNNGDDCVVIMERSDETRFMLGLSEWFVDKGFRMTVEEPVYELERIEFCQAHPVFDGSRWRMVRNPDTLVRKAAMCLVPIQNARVLRKWWGAVGDCELAANSGMPVLQEFANMYIRHGEQSSHGFKRHIFGTTEALVRTRGVDSKSSEVTALCRFSYWKAFGILPELQIARESVYRSMMLSEEILEIGDMCQSVQKLHNLAPVCLY